MCVCVCREGVYIPSSVDHLLDVGRKCVYSLTGYMTTCGSYCACFSLPTQPTWDAMMPSLHRVMRWQQKVPVKEN